MRYDSHQGFDHGRLVTTEEFLNQNRWSSHDGRRAHYTCQLGGGTKPVDRNQTARVRQTGKDPRYNRNNDMTKIVVVVIVKKR